MAALKKVTREAAARAYDQLKRDGIIDDRTQSVQLLNNDVAAALTSPPDLEFRGSIYRTRLASFREGTELQELSQKIVEIVNGEQNDNALRQLLPILERVVELIYAMCRPRGLFARLSYRVHNPFRDASRQELWELLDFFSQCRTISSVRRGGRSPNRSLN